MLASGSKLGPYEIVAPIGSGGMGEVYKARDTRLDRMVAVKVLSEAFTRDPGRLARFEREAKVVATLSHPNILAIHDIGAYEGAPYMVTELLEGETLRQKLAAGTLSIRKTLDFALQVARGLAAAHEKGIVHRDLKPENLFVSKDGRVKILDFGIAKQAQTEESSPGGDPGLAATASFATAEGIIIGTAAYMAPEQVRGRPADPRSDLFAFGALIYELLSGKVPFQGDTNSDIMVAILREDPPPLPESVPPALSRLVQHCLEKDPEDRFQSARDLAFSLEAMSFPTSASHALQEVPPAGRTFLRGPLASRILAGFAVACILAGAAFHIGRHLGHSPRPAFKRLTFQRGRVTFARFAPDGQNVIYSANWDGRPSEVFSLRLETPGPLSLGYSGAYLLAVSPSSELALDLASFGGWYEYSLAGTLAVTPLSGGTPRPLDGKINFADWSPDGKEMALVRQAATGTQLEWPPGKVVLTSSKWIVNPRFSPSGERLAFFEQVPWTDSASVVVVDRSGTRKTLTGEFNTARGLAWAPGGKEVWFAAAQSGIRDLRAVTLGGRQRVVLSQIESLVLHDIARDGRVLVCNKDSRGRVFFRGSKDAVDRELSWLDYSLLRDITPDGRRILFFEAGQGGGDPVRAYVRETDGAPPMLLGIPGTSSCFSPDGKFVVAHPKDSSTIVLSPLIPGEQPSTVELKGIKINFAKLLQDGRTLVFTGEEPPHPERMWMSDLSGSTPRPITPEGVTGSITPDGKWVLAFLPKGLAYPVAGGEPAPIQGISADDKFCGFGADGESCFVFPYKETPAKVFQVQWGTGRRELVHEIAIADRAGLIGVGPTHVVITPDGKSLAYGIQQSFQELYLIQGLK